MGAVFWPTGSGYGPSSGAKRTMTDGSTVISPPLRIVSTSESPSRRWAFTDIVRPLAKNAISAFASVANTITVTKVTRETKDTKESRVTRPVACPECTGDTPRADACTETPIAGPFVSFVTLDVPTILRGSSPILPRVYERVKHSNAQLPGILAVDRRDECRHIRLVHDNPQLRGIARAKLIGLERDAVKLLF